MCKFWVLFVTFLASASKTHFRTGLKNNYWTVCGRCSLLRPPFAFLKKKSVRRLTQFLIPSGSIAEIAFSAGTPQDDMLQDDGISITGKRELHSR
jgi:hypothetical protein